MCCIIVELTMYLKGGAVSSEAEEGEGVVSEIRSPRILACVGECVSIDIVISMINPAKRPRGRRVGRLQDWELDL